jgi:hypothetical protein
LKKEVFVGLMGIVDGNILDLTIKTASAKNATLGSL